MMKKKIIKIIQIQQKVKNKIYRNFKMYIFIYFYIKMYYITPSVKAIYEILLISLFGLAF